MTSLAAFQASSRRIAERIGISTLTLSRELNRLSDPVQGAPDLEASGAQAAGPVLLIAPQSGFSFRGSVEAGASVTITGHGTGYVTITAATVDHGAPGTLSLAITPDLEAPLVGGEVVTIAQASAVAYDSTHLTDKDAASRGWPVTPGSAMLLALHTTEREPEIGDIASGTVTGAVIQREHVRNVHSVIQVGAP